MPEVQSVTIRQREFKIHEAVVLEQMPARMRCLLLYLFFVSKAGGECAAGIAAMREAIRDRPDERGGDRTVRRLLKGLRARGWIAVTHRRARCNALIYLRIPHRYRQSVASENVLRVVKKRRS